MVRLLHWCTFWVCSTQLWWLCWLTFLPSATKCEHLAILTMGVPIPPTRHLLPEPLIHLCTTGTQPEPLLYSRILLVTLQLRLSTCHFLPNRAPAACQAILFSSLCPLELPMLKPAISHEWLQGSVSRCLPILQSQTHFPRLLLIIILLGGSGKKPNWHRAFKKSLMLIFKAF